MAHEKLVFPSEFPATIYAGDSLSFRFSDSDFPRNDGWTVQLRLNGAEALSVNGSADVDDAAAHLIAATSTTTAGWDAGFYAWAFFATKASERHTISTGTIEILANPANVSAGTEQRSFARQALAAIEVLLLNRSDQLSFSVFGRSYQYESRQALMDYRRELQRDVAEEDEAARRAAGKPTQSHLPFNFGSGW
jgi:hypothetical protein